MTLQKPFVIGVYEVQNYCDCGCQRNRPLPREIMFYGYFTRAYKNTPSIPGSAESPNQDNVKKFPDEISAKEFIENELSACSPMWFFEVVKRV